jgi:hypothetical protein
VATRGDEVVVVGDRGVVLRAVGDEPLTTVAWPAGQQNTERFFAVHPRGEGFVLAGGTGSGRLATLIAGVLKPVSTAQPLPILQGVDGPAATAVGQRGAWISDVATAPTLTFPAGFPNAESLHAVWSAPDGTTIAVGGNVLSPRLDEGVVVARGKELPPIPKELVALAPPPATSTACPDAEIDPASTGSIARRWVEQALGAIRRDTPRPTVHARNLYHLSGAMWDAYAAYDAVARPLLVGTRAVGTADDREKSVGAAAWTVLATRYFRAAGGARSEACFRAFAARTGLEPLDAPARSPAEELGRIVGKRWLAANADDGSAEAEDYADPARFSPEGPALVVDEPGVGTDPRTLDLGRWQPLNLAEAATQNGIILPAGTQGYIGAHWGGVRPFALVRPTPQAPYVDPGRWIGNDIQALAPLAIDVLEKTAALGDDTLIDTSPRAVGNSPLGTDDGRGHATNPTTGAPYGPNMVRRGDHTRLLAEYWADGPKSETPPGHWFVIANQAADTPGFPRKLFGRGDPLAPLAWDVHVYIALGGAVHDAAIAAWEIKRRELAVRPITLIRALAGRGQASAPSLPSYAADGLPSFPTSSSSSPKRAWRRGGIGAFSIISAKSSYSAFSGSRAIGGRAAPGSDGSVASIGPLTNGATS